MKKNDVVQVKLVDIVPDKFNPRQDFDEGPLKRLEDSIKKLGIMNPLLVEQVGDKYLIVDGERRYRTAKKLDIKVVPVRLQKATDAKERLIIRFNLQEVHESWTPYDKAVAVGELQKLTEWNGTELAKALGMGQTTVRYLLRINSLTTDTLQRTKKVASARTIGKLAVALSKVKESNRAVAEEAFVRSIEFGKINDDRDANRYIVAITKVKLPQLQKLVSQKKYLAEDALREADEGHALKERILYNTLMAARSVLRNVNDYIKKNHKAKVKFSDRCTDLLQSTAIVVERLRKAL